MPRAADEHPGAPFGWLDVDRIARTLAQAHPSTDPLTLRFTNLRRLVEELPGFAPDPAHPVNEKILETIQMAWREEREDLGLDEDDDED
ncbi:MAG: Fe-S cluster assembly protein IscX [Phycisphaeraceae bacterium]|nr:Fe-S cluster assembly protein IscX [Phycisphaeraceae bacterium]